MISRDIVGIMSEIVPMLVPVSYIEGGGSDLELVRNAFVECDSSQFGRLSMRMVKDLLKLDLPFYYLLG